MYANDAGQYLLQKYLNRQKYLPMKLKSKTDAVIEAMGDDEITSSDLAERIGITPQSVGAILRNARKKGLVVLIGTKVIGHGNQWHVASIWRKTKDDEIETGKPMVAITDEDLKWMDYWRNRRAQRLRRRYTNSLAACG